MAKTRLMPEFTTGNETIMEPLRTRTQVSTDTDWRVTLPVLAGKSVTLRELRPEDAPSLFAMLSNDRANKFVSPPPSTIDGFERFITWAAQERAQGRYVCYGIVPDGMTTAIGVFQMHALDPMFEVAEWGFAMGSGFWGTGVFAECAELMLTFAFDVVGVHRLEARAAINNGRGNGALRKVGATQEGVLRRSFHRGGDFHDQVLWSILAEDWRFAHEDHGTAVH